MSNSINSGTINYLLRIIRALQKEVFDLTARVEALEHPAKAMGAGAAVEPDSIRADKKRRNNWQVY